MCNRLRHFLQGNARLARIVSKQQEAGRRSAGKQGQPHRAAQHGQQASGGSAQASLSRGHGCRCSCLPLPRLSELDRHFGLDGSTAGGNRLALRQQGRRLGFPLLSNGCLKNGVCLSNPRIPLSERSSCGLERGGSGNCCARRVEGQRADKRATNQPGEPFNVIRNNAQSTGQQV